MERNTGRQATIIARELQFDVQQTMKKQRYWHNNDPVSTHFLNALQSAFPESELFFIESARDGVAAIGEEQFNAEQLRNIKGFIKQEALHGKQHRAINDALVANGYEKIAEFDARLAKARKLAREKYSILFRLGLTAAAEHFTATLSRYALLKNNSLIEQSKEPFRQLLFYHAYEEIEHKAIVFDLYKTAGGGYLLRAFTHVLGMLDVLLSTRFKHKYLLKKDGLWNVRYRIKAFWFVWGLKGVAWGLLPDMLKYFIPGFHPWHTNELNEVAARYPGRVQALNSGLSAEDQPAPESPSAHVLATD